MKLSNVIGTAILFGVVSGFCADIKSDYDRSADLSQLKTFTFKDQSWRSGGDALAKNELADKRLRNEIATNLGSIGIQQNATAPDFVIAYYATVKKKAQVTTSGHLRFAGGQVWIDEYTEGTAVVDFVNAKTGELIWRGYMTGTVSDPSKSEQKIHGAVKKLIERFAKDKQKQQVRKN